MNINDIDEWYEKYSESSFKIKYGMIMDLLDEKLSHELIEDMDLGLTLTDFLSILISNNQIDLMLQVMEKLRQRQPEIYKDEYPYIGGFLTTYYLFKRDEDNIAASFENYTEDPVKGIDEFIVEFNKLVLYKHTGLAHEIAEKVLRPVAESPDIIPGGEYDFLSFLWSELNQNIYINIKDGREFDWENTRHSLDMYGFSNPDEALNGLKNYYGMDEHARLKFKQEMMLGNSLKNHKAKEKAWEVLFLDFAIYMFGQSGIEFGISSIIWDEIMSFLEDDDRKNNNSSSINKYFCFKYEEFDRFVAHMIGDILSLDEYSTFTLLWGMPYLYEFLKYEGYISEDMLKNTIDICNGLKSEIIKIYKKSLWKYDFVHEWGKPDSISSEEFTAETDIFSGSIRINTPIGDIKTGDLDITY